MPEQELAKPVYKRADYVLLAILGLLVLAAAVAMGSVLGYMTAVSESPVGHAAISGLFGIIGALAAVKALNGAVSGRIGIVGAICVVLAIIVFCGAFHFGLVSGADTRNQQVIYSRSMDLIGTRLDYADPQIAAEINAFRIKCRLAGVKANDYSAAMLEVVRPIINDDKADKLERLQAAIAILEEAVTKPDLKSDEKPKAEPAKEPPTADKTE